MKKKVFAVLTVVTLCSAMFISFNASATVDNPDPVDGIELRFRRDKIAEGTLMQCVSLSFSKCLYVKDLGY